MHFGRRHPRGLRLWLLAALGLAAAAIPIVPVDAIAQRAPTLEDILAHSRLSETDIRRVRQGEIVWHQWSERSVRDLAMVIAYQTRLAVPELVNAAMDELVDLHVDPSVLQVRRIRGEVTPETFAGVRLDEAEATRFLKARPGAELNLSAHEIERFRALGAAGADPLETSAAVRRLLVERVRAYRERGLDGISPYARAKGEALEIGLIMRRAIGRHAGQGLDRELTRILVEYPKGLPPGTRETFMWIERERQGRQIFTLRHRMVLSLGEQFVGLDREFYVSGVYNSFQGVAVVLPVEDGTLLFQAIRTSTDQVTGFGAAARRRIGREVMAGQFADLIERTRSR